MRILCMTNALTMHLQKILLYSKIHFLLSSFHPLEIYIQRTKESQTHSRFLENKEKSYLIELIYLKE